MAKGPTTQKPENFPILETINEECEIIDNVAKKFEKEEETDLNNVTDSGKDSADENGQTVRKKSKGKYTKSGIGFTLKKVRLGYITLTEINKST